MWGEEVTYGMRWDGGVPLLLYVSAVNRRWFHPPIIIAAQMKSRRFSPRERRAWAAPPFCSHDLMTPPPELLPVFNRILFSTAFLGGFCSYLGVPDSTGDTHLQGADAWWELILQVPKKETLRKCWYFPLTDQTFSVIWGQNVYSFSAVIQQLSFISCLCEWCVAIVTQKLGEELVVEWCFLM